MKPTIPGLARRDAYEYLGRIAPDLDLVLYIEALDSVESTSDGKYYMADLDAVADAVREKMRTPPT